MNVNINRTRTDNWFYYISTASITVINIKTSNNQKVREHGQQWSKVKTFLLQCCALQWQMTDGQSMHDQSGFDALHTFSVEVQMNADYIHATHV